MKNPAWALIAIIIVTGVLVTVNNLLYLDILGIGRFITRKKFPEAAARLGFKAQSEWSHRIFPEYSGRYREHDVLIAHERSSIRVSIQPVPGLFLNTFKKNIQFNTGNSAVDLFFSERKAPQATCQKIINSTDLLAYIESFIKKWGKKCRKVDLEPGYIECALKFGNGHYIPAWILEPIVSDMVKLADLLQAAVAEK